LSGRALAASARRAGFLPFVLDAFGDADTRALAGGVRTLRGHHKSSSRDMAVQLALDALREAAGGEIAGLILGPGFEDRASLAGHLGERYGLLGCSAKTIRLANDPATFFGLLSELGIEHPETVLKRPGDTRGWLSKRAGACGGRHIRRLPAPEMVPSQFSYYQREADGLPVSALAITGASGTAFAFTRSWSAPRRREPFRFGGIVSAEELDAELEARLVDTCLALIKPLGLVGLVSFDFLVSDSNVLLLEVNPRPGASLDVLDDAGGTLFKAHIAACRGEDAVEILASQWRPKPHACAYLYADQGEVEIGAVNWPGWVSDVPASGQHIRKGNPIATVHAEAETPQIAREICAKRLEKLAAVVYPDQNDEKI